MRDHLADKTPQMTPRRADDTTRLISDTNTRIRTELLSQKPFDTILSYPRRLAQKDLDNRIEDLIRMGVTSVSFVGPVGIGRLQVLGKGFAGVVLLAHTSLGDAALKIRRADSPRNTMYQEAILLDTSNRAGVGPKLLAHSDDSVLMERIEGPNISQWLQNLPDQKTFKNAIRQILHDCFRLDQAGLDHGELVDASHHVIMSDRPVIIDFDSASVSRRTSNITSITQCLFVLGRLTKLAAAVHHKPPMQDVIDVLRSYKQNPNNTSFTRLLGVLRLCGGTGEIRTHDL